MQTGLRASELASLTAASFDLDNEPPTVAVEAAYSKHRRRDVLPVRSDLAERLRPWLAKRAGGPLWPGTWVERSARMFRADLDAARVEWLKAVAENPAEHKRRTETDYLKASDDAGRVADFHALRHSFISGLAKAGVHPKEAQTLSRHSTISLTLDRYTHLGVVDVAAALDRLPALPAIDQPAQGAELRATGTDGATLDGARDSRGASERPSEKFVPRLVPPSDFSRREPSRVGSPAESQAAKSAANKPRRARGLDADRRELSRPVASSGAGTRTPDTRIMIPLL